MQVQPNHKMFAQELHRYVRGLCLMIVFAGVALTLMPVANQVMMPVSAKSDRAERAFVPQIPCAEAIDVPESECQVLLDFYFNNDGGSWLQGANWSIELTVCTWYGITCAGGHVTKVELPSNNVVGTLPAAIADLPELLVLDLHRNRLSGTIPTEITTLTKLSRLRLDENLLSGELPVNLGDLSNLTVFWISDNSLSGPLPTSIGNVTKLREFYANNNNFDSPIPAELSGLPDLHSIYLAGNQFSGPIPGELGNMPHLIRLILVDNQLTGSFPISLTKASSLTLILVNKNPLTGNLPAEIADLTNLDRLDISDTQIDGPLPLRLSELTALTTFSFQNANVCIPTDTTFQAWLARIGTVESNNNPCTTVGTPTVTSTAMPTATPTATGTASALATATATPTATPTASTTPSITRTPITAVGDRYEPNDSCQQARTIASDGTFQQHTIHHADDVDWVQFTVEAGEAYVVRIDPPAQSSVFAQVEIYLDCVTAVDAGDRNFAPGVHIEFTAPAAGSAFLKISDRAAGAMKESRLPSNAGYDLSVRRLQRNAPTGALILVAGSLYGGDLLQPNIYHVTDATRTLFMKHGYTDETIYYLAPDRDHANVDALATTANLEAAITTWATDKVGVGRPLTLYLIDHGSEDRIYLDKEAGEWLTPTALDSWLTTLEARHPGLLVNVIIEMCYAGSFISTPQTVSRPNRVVIASTDDTNLAYASLQGAYFSDRLLEALDHKASLYSSFQLAQNGATAATSQIQRPWLDGDGDGIANEEADFLLAAQRGFDFAGTFDDDWPPYIADASAPTGISANQRLIQAAVFDDIRVEEVWAIVYPPSYRAPTTSEALVQVDNDETLTVLRLRDTDNDGVYSSSYAGFTEQGTYRIVIHAEDDRDLAAQPVAITVTNGNVIYLPLVQR